MMDGKSIGSRCILSVLVIATYTGNEYELPPSYDRTAQLEDIWTMTELVVLGTTGERAIEVEEILFGKSSELTDTKRKILLSVGPRILSGKRGVWFLVRGGDGYVPLNQGCTAVPREEFGKLRPPTTHWTNQENLEAHRDNTQLYYCYAKPGVKYPVWHGTNVWRCSDGEIFVELNLHGERELSLTIDPAGSVRNIIKSPSTGHGFFLKYDNGQLVEFGHFKDRKRHGVYQRYSKENPKQLCEEKHFIDGIIDGRSREWNDKGKMVKDITFDMGFIPPVFRYEGRGESGVSLHRSDDGVTYSSAPVVHEIKIGMTEREVSDLLMVDFSPTQGLMFPLFRIDVYRHIGFKDGKVSEIHDGHNGACIQLHNEPNANGGK